MLTKILYKKALRCRINPCVVLRDTGRLFEVLQRVVEVVFVSVVNLSQVVLHLQAIFASLFSLLIGFLVTSCRGPPGLYPMLLIN